MRIEPETYRVAAAEHVVLAEKLYEQGKYVYALYVAGVSVECVLRAHMKSAEFDSRHDLPALLRESRLLERLPVRHVDRIADALVVLWARWRNTHRYFSAERMKRFLVDHRLHRGFRGDPLKENARRGVQSAVIIVTQGVQR